MKKGLVYVLVNAAMPGLVKIGSTTRGLQERIRELSADTGVPTPFAEAYSAEFFDPEKIERQIHSALTDFRCHNRREFFRLKVSEAIQKIQEFEHFVQEKENYCCDIIMYLSQSHHRDNSGTKKSLVIFGWKRFDEKIRNVISICGECFVLKKMHGTSDFFKAQGKIKQIFSSYHHKEPSVSSSLFENELRSIELSLVPKITNIATELNLNQNVYILAIDEALQGFESAVSNGDIFLSEVQKNNSLPENRESVWTYGGRKKYQPFTKREMDEIDALKSEDKPRGPVPTPPHARALCPRCRTAGWIFVEEDSQKCWSCNATHKTETWITD